MIRKVLLLISVVLLAAVCTPIVAAPDRPPEVMFILDASGSMWGQIGGRSKIQIAREVLSNVVMGLPRGVKVGLTVYGHRRRGDCSDIEILIPAGSSNRSALLAKVRRIQPRGKTPIAASIKLVAKAISHRDVQTSIVLVSDGIETCNNDPCGVVKALKKAGIRFVMHVVGFAVGRRATAQLTCMAKAGGGLYFGAKDAPTLLRALKRIAKKVAKKAPQKVVPQQKVFRVFRKVPERYSAYFKRNKRNWVNYLSIDTRRWDKIPYLVAPPFRAQIVIKRGQKVMLTSSSSGTGSGNWWIDQFLFFMIEAPGKKPVFFYVGYMPNIPIYYKGLKVPRVGPERHWFRPETIKFERYFPIGIPFRLTILALDIGVKGSVTDLFLVIR